MAPTFCGEWKCSETSAGANRLDPVTESKFDKIETRLNELMAVGLGTAGDVKALLHSSSDHEKRLRALEQFRWQMVGVAVGPGSAAGGLIAAAVKMMGA